MLAERHLELAMTAHAVQQPDDVHKQQQQQPQPRDASGIEFKDAPIVLPDMAECLDRHHTSVLIGGVTTSTTTSHHKCTTHRTLVCKTTRWHWLVLTAVFTVVLAYASLPQSFGVLMLALRKTSGRTLFELSWITALTNALPLLAQPLAMYLLRPRVRFFQAISSLSFVLLFLGCVLSSLTTHPEVLLLTYSLLYGFGSCFILTVSLLILADYFPSNHPRHVLGTSLYQVAYPLASLLFNPVLRALIEAHEWHNAFRMLGVILLSLGGFASFLLRPRSRSDIRKDNMVAALTDPPSFSSILPTIVNGSVIVTQRELDATITKQHRPVSQTSTTSTATNTTTTTSRSSGSSTLRLLVNVVPFCSWAELQERPEIGLWCLAKGLNYLCWCSISVNLHEYLVESGYSQRHASYLTTTFTVGEIAGGIVCSTLGSFLAAHLISVHLLACAGLTLVCTFWRLLIGSYELALFVSAFMGTLLQLSLSFTYPTAAAVTLLPLHRAMATSMTAAGVGLLLAPLLGCVLGCELLFYLLAALWLVQTALLAACLFLRNHRQQRCL